MLIFRLNTSKFVEVWHKAYHGVRSREANGAWRELQNNHTQMHFITRNCYTIFLTLNNLLLLFRSSLVAATFGLFIEFLRHAATATRRAVRNKDITCA